MKGHYLIGSYIVLIILILIASNMFQKNNKGNDTNDYFDFQEFVKCESDRNWIRSGHVVNESKIEIFAEDVVKTISRNTHVDVVVRNDSGEKTFHVVPKSEKLKTVAIVPSTGEILYFILHD